jgi:hypothetical protein
MEIGNKVLLSDGQIGTIINKEVPSCKCKGQGNWVIEIKNVVEGMFTKTTIKSPINVPLEVIP